MLAADEDRNIHISEKLLEELPGKPAEIHKDLSALLKDPKAKVAAERASHIKHIRYCLEGNKISGAMRRAIQAKIAAFANPPIKLLPADALIYMFSFFSPRERLRLTPVCKTWRVVAQDRNYWLNQLVQFAGVKREEINDLVEPHRIYRRFREIDNLASVNRSYARLLKEVTLIAILHMLDSIEGIRKYFTIADKASWSCDLSLVVLTGCLPFVQYCIEAHRLKPNRDTLNNAALSGSLSLVKYLIETHRLKPNRDTFNNAVFSGSLSLVQYLIEMHRFKPDSETLTSKAVFSGNLPLVKYLIETCHLKPDKNTLHNIAVSGNLSLMQYLIETHRFKPDSETLHYAAISGRLPLVQYLVETCYLIPHDEMLSYSCNLYPVNIVSYFQHILKMPQRMLKATLA